LAEVSQIIALATQVRDLSSKLNETVTLATEVQQNATGAATTVSGSRKNRGVWKVAEWRLKYDGDTKKDKDGNVYHWCKEEHWSGGVAHNGMYARHLPGKHDEWRKEMDEQRRKRREKFTRDTPPAGSKTVVNDATKKKLALAESLQTALATQAGLSQQAFSNIWTESCKESGND
jgi:hypothetical protein